MSILNDPEAFANVPTPSGSQQALYLDSSSGLWSSKTAAGASTAVGGGWAGRGGFVNQFRNGAFDIAQRGVSGSVSAAANVYTMDGWKIGATGASAAWAQEYNANLTGNSLRLSAASGLTAVQLGQRIESTMSTRLLAQGKTPQAVTVQWTIYNNSGAAITPQVATSYPTVQDNWASLTGDLATTNLQTIPNGSVGTVAYTFVPSANCALGYAVSLLLGAALNGSSGYVDIGAADIRATPGAATGLCANPPSPELRPASVELELCQRYLPAFTDDGSGITPFGQSVVTVANSSLLAFFPFQTATRVKPTGITATAASSFTTSAPVSQTPTAVAYNNASTTIGTVNCTITTGTAGQACLFRANTAGAQILFTGCEL